MTGHRSHAPTDLEWQNRKACGDLDANDIDPVFFPHSNSDGMEAKEICGRCVVAADCLRYALDPATRQEHGVWGGFTESERRALLRRRAKQRGNTGTAVVSVNEPTPDERCGTYAGTRAHRKRKEWLCDDCRDARALYENERRRKDRAARDQEMTA